jgi:hypothetical protein
MWITLDKNGQWPVAMAYAGKHRSATDLMSFPGGLVALCACQGMTVIVSDDVVCQRRYRM